MKVPDLLYAIRELHRRYPGARATLIEAQSTGKQIVAMLQREIPGLIAIKPDKSKENRLSACLPQFEAGSIYIPSLGSQPWVEEYIRELLTFPASSHQDQVDATTQALNWIHENQGVGKPWVFTL
jgi:predicted phage terminase large subunit-like protein